MIDMEFGHKSAFEMKDGSIKTQKSVAVSVSVLDSSGAIIWQTADIHVPDPSVTEELVVPASTQVWASMLTLLAEAQSYIEFVQAEPDLVVEVDVN